jgi:DNA polymerase-3 subunit delta'
MWDKIKDQEKAKSVLKNIFRIGKVSHAYIFYGPEGTGKDAAAVEFAKLLNCNDPVNGEEACDKCKNCIEIDSFRSSLMKFTTALPTGKSSADDDSNPLEKLDKEDFAIYLEEMEIKAGDKYHKIFLPRANDIRISSIRQIKKEIYLTGSAGKKKVFIISGCDRMNTQSANSLLKILEEPPRDSILLLTTSKINSLLPTIIGRCQKIKFNNLPKEEILKYIYEKFPGAGNSEAEFSAELSEGSITRCNDILGKNYSELRDKVLEYLSSTITGQDLRLGREIDFVIGKRDKERIKQFLMLLSVWFRDLSAVRSGNPEIIINKDKEDRLKKFDANFDSENYKILNLIEESVKEVDGNMIPDLMLHDLSYKIRSLVKKKK